MSTFGRYMIIVLLSLGLVGAGDTTQRFEKLGHGLMCTCGCNQILLECNHVGCPSSSKMRDELTAALDAGKDNEAVFAVFVEKYGPTVLAAPTKKGFDLVAWIVPFAIFFAGIGVLLVMGRKWKMRMATVPAGSLASDPQRVDSLRDRIRQETEL